MKKFTAENVFATLCRADETNRDPVVYAQLKADGFHAEAVMATVSLRVILNCIWQDCATPDAVRVMAALREDYGPHWITEAYVADWRIG